MLLAAQSFERLVESFPEDSLADDAGLEAARSYRRLWRKPGLDPKYGETALASYNTLIGLYPTSPLVAAAQKDIAELENWFAKKDYDAGMYYFRRKAYDSGILYFKDVLAKFANAPMARDAAMKLVEAYKAIRYREDASELCTQMTPAILRPTARWRASAQAFPSLSDARPTRLRARPVKPPAP